MFKKHTVLIFVIYAAVCSVMTGCGVQETSSAEPASSSAINSVTESQSYDSEIATAENAEEDEFEKMDFVNDKINELTSSDDYKNATLDEQQKLAYEMLADLEKDGYIRNLYYSSEDSLISFQYANGALGGVSLKDFSTKPGEVPMN